MKKFLVAYLVLSIFILVGLRDLIRFPFYTSHDGFTHTARIAAFDQTWRAGQFPPRWAVNLYNGLGSPIFVYSYPLPYFLGALVHRIGFSYQDSFRAVMGLSFILAGLTSFWWLKNRFGWRAGLVGAIFYLWVPHRFLNLYVRAALAESLAYGFVPLVFWAMDTRRYKILALSLAAVLLSQNEVAALTLPLFVGWAIWTKVPRKTYLAMALAFVMSSFIYLPDFFERQFIHFDTGISYYRDHFVAWWQLLRSRWDYGFDLPGTLNDAMSFQLGLTQLAAVLSLFLIIIFKKFRAPKMTEAFFWFVVLAGSIFLMTDEPLVYKVWQITPVIKTIVDFPWRFLGVTTIAFAFLSAYLVSLLRSSPLVAAVLLAVVFIANRNHIHINLPQNFSDQDFLAYRGNATSISNEYLPVWHEGHSTPVNEPKIVPLSGSFTTTELSDTAWGLSWTVQSSAAALAKVNRFYFPQTKIYRDGQLLVENRDWDVIHKQIIDRHPVDDTGIIRLKIAPPGGKYQLVFSDTRLRRLANILSFVSPIGIIFL